MLAGDTAVLVHNTNYPCGKVSYGSTDASQMAIDYRRQAGIGSDQNVAIYNVALPNGKVANLAFANNVRGAHSEANAEEFLSGLGFSVDDVVGIYSERNFCTTPNHDCAGKIAQYGGATLSWSFDKGENAWASIINAVHG